MSDRRPSVVVLAGPNGAGKSTAAPALLRGTLAVTEFVNADMIARGLSGFQPEKVALTAGRIMWRRLEELARQRARFAFETTLAGKRFAPWLERLGHEGFQVHIVFLWLPSPELAIARVADRVRTGGHSVPEETIRRRYRSGLANFFGHYQAVATTWRFYDNTDHRGARLIASGKRDQVTTIKDPGLWARIKGGSDHDT
jgi:predicted ABC-type ATPase